MNVSELPIQQQSTVRTGYDAGQTDVKTTDVAMPASVLDGEGVKVRSSTDFEKLLAEMQSERKDKNFESYKGQLSANLASLCAQYEGATVDQKAAIDATVTASEDVSEAEAAVAEAEAGVESADAAVADAQKAVDTAAQGAEDAQAKYDADSIALAVETAKLEAMVEASVTTPEEREAQLEKEELDAENRASEEEIAAQQQKVAELEQTVKNDKTDLDLATAAKTEADAALTEAQTAKTDADAALAEAQTAKTEADAALATALAALDKVGLLVVADAALATSRKLLAAMVERGDTGGEKSVNAIIKAIGEYADAIQEMQDEKLAEETAKITPEIIYLATADLTIPVDELPEYEKHV